MMPDVLMLPILLLHTSSTLIMVGVIWYVQLVHYPLFYLADESRFIDFEAQHTRRTSWVVIPPMLAELVTAFLLLVSRPAAISFTNATTGMGLVVLIWFSTFLLQVPQHEILSKGYNQQACIKLVNTNWIRTVAWSARGVLAIWMVGKCLTI